MVGHSTDLLQHLSKTSCLENHENQIGAPACCLLGTLVTLSWECGDLLECGEGEIKRSLLLMHGKYFKNDNIMSSVDKHKREEGCLQE